MIPDWARYLAGAVERPEWQGGLWDKYNAQRQQANELPEEVQAAIAADPDNEQGTAPAVSPTVTSAPPGAAITDALSPAPAGAPSGPIQKPISWTEAQQKAMANGGFNGGTY
jgi:hypothetical protein